MVDKVETIRRLEELADYFYRIYLDEENMERFLEAKDRYAAIQDTLELLKEDAVHELTKEEWEHWKNAKRRDPICMIYKHDDTRTPIWVLDPNKVHEPALLMGEIKLFTWKPTFEQCKAVKWE